MTTTGSYHTTAQALPMVAVIQNFAKSTGETAQLPVITAHATAVLPCIFTAQKVSLLTMTTVLVLQ